MPDVDDRVDLSVYAPRIATRWLRDHPDQRWSVPDGTVVFADITGFTPMTERLSKRGKVGAEELTDILNDVFGRLLRVADQHGGDLLKFGGDALLLLFTGGEHAARASAAAHAMQLQLRPFRRFRSEAGSLSLTMSVGVATGPCYLFLVGDSHRELMVAGPVFSRAVELEGDAGSGQVLLSAEVAAQLPASASGEPLGSGVLLGKPPEPRLRPARQDPHPVPVDPGLLVPTALREHLQVRRTEGEHRVAVLTFLQFRGTDQLLQEAGPEGVAEGLDQLLRSVQAASEALDVALLATDIDRDGGKILLSAGAPRYTSRDEDVMLLALHRVMTSPQRLCLRAGVNVGRAFAVDVGSLTRRTFAVMGDATNLAARVMGRAEPGQVVATQAVLERTHGLFDAQPLEPFRVKGKSDPVRGSVVGAARTTVHERREEALPLLGRAEDLALLEAAVGDAQAGHGRVVEVVGEAGIGKTHLLAELRRQTAGLPQLVVEGNQYLATSPYLALRAPLRQLLGVGEAASDDDVLAALALLVGQVGSEHPANVHAMSAFLGVAAEERAWTDLDSGSRRDLVGGRPQEFGLELLQLLLPRPALLVIDDAHLLDEATVEVLRHVLELVPSKPWAVVLARRPTATGLVAPTVEHVTSLELSPLPEHVTNELVGQLVGDAPLASHARRSVVARSGGNPLFLIELVRATLSGSSVESLPDTVEATIAASLDQVHPTERDLVRRAAVLGPRFPVALLRAWLSELPGAEDVDQVLGRLSRWFTVDGGEARFKRAIVRDVAYEGLSFRRRRELHGRAGDLVMEYAGHRPEEFSSVLATHFHAAGRYDETWRWSVEAAHRARATAAPVEAADLLRWALDAGRHLDVPDRERQQVWEALGDVCELSGSYEQAQGAYRNARRLSADDPLERAQLHQKEGWLRERSKAYRAAVRWYQRGLQILEEVPPSSARTRLEGQLLTAYAAARTRQGRYAESLPLLDRVVHCAQEVDDRNTLAHAYYLLEWAHSELGNPEADTYRHMALPLYEELGDWHGMGNALNNLGVNAYYEGRWDEAAAYYRRATEARRRSGDTVQDVTTNLNLGEILSDQGHLEQAQRSFEEALSAWRAVNFPLGIGFATSNLARVHVRSGRAEDAGPHYAQARALFEDIGADACVRETDAREAERLLVLGQPASAFALVEKVTAALGSDAEAATGGSGVLLAMLHRLAGIALAASGQVEEGLSRLERGVRCARAAQADFELALTLDALCTVASSWPAAASDRSAEAAEAEEIFARLDVVVVPRLYLATGG